MSIADYRLSSLDDTKNLAKNIARIIVPDFVIILNGDLGTGKTTLVREVLYLLGVNGNIKSPTFTYVEPYILKNFTIYHFDLYRFSDPEEWFSYGFDEYFTNLSTCFIEWPEKAGGLIPRIDWVINLQIEEDIRICQIKSMTNKGQECLKNLIV